MNRFHDLMQQSELQNSVALCIHRPFVLVVVIEIYAPIGLSRCCIQRLFVLVAFYHQNYPFIGLVMLMDATFLILKYGRRTKWWQDIVRHYLYLPLKYMIIKTCCATLLWLICFGQKKSNYSITEEEISCHKRTIKDLWRTIMTK